ncbi:MAG: sensor histidine kinase [Thermoanaerobaculales bacterium]
MIVLAVGLVDYATRWEFSFSVFYLLAVGVATWFVGKVFGVTISVVSVVVSLGGDFASSPHYDFPLQPYWNASIILAFYLIVVWLLTRLRALHQELEDRVRQRTVALTNEIGERQRLEMELFEISEREQQRIGHDLHDGLCQHLTGAALAGQVLEEKLAAHGAPEAADARKVVELVEDGITLSRNLARGLDPIEMTADGLMQALNGLAVTTADLFKISCRLECDSPVLIHDPAASGHMYRIAQEAISNAIKHGRAKTVTVHLEPLEDGLELRITDDGVGLPDALPDSAGMGLRIMAHRAGIIGATFVARRNDFGGTTIACALPQRRGSEDPA